MGAVHILFLALGIALIGSSLYLTRLTVKFRAGGGAGVVSVHILLRFAAGVMALWLAAGGARAAGLLFAALVVADTVFMSGARRLRG